MSIQIKGANKLARMLAKLEKRDARNANRKATRAGGAEMAKAIKPGVPVDENVLKRATSYKVFGRGMNLGAVAGADVSKLTPDESRPSNIDHLVEFGHVAPDGTFVPPYPYFRRAAPEATARAEAAYIERLKAEIEQAVS